jgi:D-glycero-beta-D-manno-heptose-7-phosphate kinase
MIKILVVGESCTDRFVYGKTERLCPEAPVPVFKPIEIKENLGMGYNVVQNLKSLIENTRIDFITQKETIVKTRFVEKKSNHIFLRVDEGENNLCDEIEEIEYEKLKKFDIVIVSDYNKGFLTNDIIEKIGRNSRLSILDSKRILTNEIVDSYTFVKLNKEEFEKNRHLSNTENIIVTLGGFGATINNVLYSIKKPIETIDVSGAGDTFVASFILKFYEKKNIGKSIKFANKMSSLVVGKRGIATPK